MLWLGIALIGLCAGVLSGVFGIGGGVLIVPALITWMIRLVPPAVMHRCREQAQGMWQDGRPKKWYYALPVLILWALILWWLWQIFHH